MRGVIKPGDNVMLGVRVILGEPYLNYVNPRHQKVDIGDSALILAGSGPKKLFSEIRRAPRQDGKECHSVKHLCSRVTGSRDRQHTPFMHNEYVLRLLVSLLGCFQRKPAANVSAAVNYLSAH